MAGHVDDTFVSVPASRTVSVAGEWIEGIWVPGASETKPYTVNIHQASDREVDFIRQGGERICIWDQLEDGTHSLASVERFNQAMNELWEQKEALTNG